MKSFILHDSHNPKYRSPFGAVPTECGITLRLEVNTHLHIAFARLHLIQDGEAERQYDMILEQKEGESYIYSIKLNSPATPNVMWYYFKLEIDRVVYFYGNNHNSFGGVGGISHTIPPAYQITVYKKDAVTPAWFKSAVMYQIFVDRFLNGNEAGKVLNPKNNIFLYGNWEDAPCYIKDIETGGILRWDFFGGNLEGVIKKLDYLKELGIDVIYLNPVFESPSNHKYDTADYKKIDPMFGDEDTFKKLCGEAEKRNIAIILDGVFSHTGCDSIYFNKYNNYCEVGAYQSAESPYYSWYRFKENKDAYDCWWGIGTMPNVEEMNPKYREFIIRGEDSVIKHWMKMGAKGWRLDVADELPDEFIKELRMAMKEQDKDSVLIGEVWEDASNKQSYGNRRRYLQGEELDSVMNYPFKNILIDFLLFRKSANEASAALMSIRENYPIHNFYCNMNIIGTHDTARALTILGEAPLEEHLTARQKEVYKLDEHRRKIGISRIKLISLVQMTFPGVPSIYYGDEAGLEGYSDPLNRRTFPWGKENKELINWYKEIVAIRKQNKVLSLGKYEPLYVSEDIFAFIRSIDENKDAFGDEGENAFALIIINRSNTSYMDISLKLNKWEKELLSFKEKLVIDLLDKAFNARIDNSCLTLSLDAMSGRILMIKN